ncbi:tetratricopeptide repeat protein [Porphyromonas macacae]|uniref:tetratricopeptide repeat protein n=1 Tax=Porphyromonas macacae TaxID=28115 RepID=UPI00359F3791
MKKKLNDIYTLIKSRRLSEAFGKTRALINSDEVMKYTAKIDELESIYHDLLSYYIRGIEDVKREDILLYVGHNLAEVADLIVYETEKRNSSGEFYNRLRFCSGIDELGIIKLIEEALVVSDRRAYDRYVQDLFYAIWVTRSLSEEQVQAIFDTRLDDYLLCVVASALMMSLEEWWDLKKIELILGLLTRRGISPRLRARLWTAVAFTVRRYPLQIELHGKTLSPILQTVIDEHPHAAFELRFVIKRLYAALETEDVNRKVQKEVIDGLRHISPDVSHKLDLFGDQFAENGANPDWFKAIEGTGLDDTLRELSEMQDRGADVMYSSFKGMKRNLFFSEMPNWFIPFDMQHSHIAHVVSDDGFRDVARMMSTQLCDTDMYGLLATLALMPEHLRMQALTQMSGANISEMKEQLELREISDDTDLYKREVKRYLEDLYRFYKDFKIHREFDDRFDEPYPLDVVFLHDLLNDISFEREIVDILLGQKRYREAAGMLTVLCEKTPDDALVNEKRGWALQLAGDYAKALEAYAHADLIGGETYWVTRQRAECNHRLGNYELALADYERCFSLKPENKSLLLRAASCLMALKKWEEALSFYYKYEFTASESLQTKRPIAWCLLMSGAYERAFEVYKNIIETFVNDLRAPDFLNAGHAALMVGKREESVDFYLKSKNRYMEADSEHGEREFYRSIADDFHTLLLLGASYEQLRLLTEWIRFSSR